MMLESGKFYNGNTVLVNWESLEDCKVALAYHKRQLEDFVNGKIILDDVELRWVKLTISKFEVQIQKLTNTVPDWMQAFL